MESPSWKNKLTGSLLTVPDIFWGSFFNKISFDDMKALLDEDSGFRDALITIIRDDSIYMKQIEKNIILECIDDLEKEIDIQFQDILRDFFIQKGFIEFVNNEKNYPKYKKIVIDYLDTLIDMYRKNKYDYFKKEYIDSEIQKLEIRKMEKMVPFDLIEDYKHRSFHKFHEFNEVSKKYRRKIDKVNDIIFRNFVNDLFYEKNSYENVKEYLETIKNSMDKKYHPYLFDCIEYRWSVIKEKLKDKKK
jgi:hypothetical protein